MPSAIARLLIADDQRDVLEALRLLLKNDGYLIDTVESPAAVVTALGQRDYDVVLIDLNYARDTTSGAEGLDLLRQIQQVDASLPVVVMTAWGSVHLAVEAMRRGARDFIEKPWDNERLLAIIRTQAELGRALRRADRLEAHTRSADGDAAVGLIAEAAAMQPVLQIIARVGPSDANVLITGENGTGKSLVAKAVHAVSPRGSRPMVTINAGGVSEGVFESELFGHVKGAFSGAIKDRVGRFEAATGGTLFLDEVGELPLELQGKLLRVLQEGTYQRVGEERTRHADVRLVAATNRELFADVERGRFRQDLYYRLAVYPIALPPLRARKEDVPDLAVHLLARICRRMHRPPVGLTAPQLAYLAGRDWPGNVRELRNVLERAVISASDGPLRLAGAEDRSPARLAPLGPVVAVPALEGPWAPTPAGESPPSRIISDAEMRRRERDNIHAALDRCHGKIYGADGAAALLGIKPTTLASRLKRLRLPRELPALRRAHR
jgi:DNA-binding NtrC family response regulator